MYKKPHLRPHKALSMLNGNNPSFKYNVLEDGCIIVHNKTWDECEQFIIKNKHRKLTKERI